MHSDTVTHERAPLPPVARAAPMPGGGHGATAPSRGRPRLSWWRGRQRHAQLFLYQGDSLSLPVLAAICVVTLLSLVAALLATIS